jgi:hypothetical protein
MSAKFERRDRNAVAITSGVIRATPAAAPAQPPAPPAARRDAPAAVGATPAMLDIMRKAESRTTEQGACANLSIRSGETLDGFFDRARTGDYFASKAPGAIVPFCSVIKVTAVTLEGGRKCARIQYWKCNIGSDCSIGTNKACHDKSGWMY